ncbi:hypothetical protein MG293_005633 [Ovis ammon polii]|uniref:Glutathione peroxidase n=2 Tax=Ovis TaxID=9935 RepID=A0A835ZM51_SHEEP|nr:hypothetical protein JEQ12_020030 [Ovis aries]KAI4545367.1 hypothetical protein MG293_005633 [Ovis ammon polii]
MAAPRCSTIRAVILASFPYSGLFHRRRRRGASLMRRNFLKARFQEKLAFGTGFYGSVQSLQKQKFQTASQGKGRCAQIFKGVQDWAPEQDLEIAVHEGFFMKESPIWRKCFNYEVEGKIAVASTGVHPAFKYLMETSGKEPSWNFWKYLVAPDGKVIGAWDPSMTVEEIRLQVTALVMKLILKKQEDL